MVNNALSESVEYEVLKNWREPCSPFISKEETAMTNNVVGKPTERYFLIEEMTIIVAENQEQAEAHYLKEIDHEWEKEVVEEIQDDFIVDGVQDIGGEGFIEVHLCDALENKALPYIVEGIELI